MTLDKTAWEAALLRLKRYHWDNRQPGMFENEHGAYWQVAAVLDALSSLPAQAVGVKALDANGYPTGSTASAADDDQFAARLADGSAALAPSQPAAVGVTDEMVGRFMEDMFGEYTTPGNDQTWVSPNWMETKAKVRAALEAALRSTP